MDLTLTLVGLLTTTASPLNHGSELSVIKNDAIFVDFGFLVGIPNVNEIMSEITNYVESFDIFLEGERQLKGAGQTGAARIPLHWSRTLHMMNVMLHLLQIKGLYGEQAYEELYVYLKNFLEVCGPFNIAHTTQ